MVKCIAPFISQAQWADGGIGICCNDKQYRIGESLYEEWNSDRRRKIRLEMATGKIPKDCRDCFDRIEKGDNNLPKWNNQFASWSDVENFLQRDGSMTNRPSYLHLSPSNRCNLACRMCRSTISSTYASQVDGISLVSNYADDIYLSYIKKALPTLRHYVFHGGEPIRSPAFLKIIKILKTRKDDLPVNLIWNGTSLKTCKESIIPHLAQFKNLMITFSLDSVPTINDYMRTFTNTKQAVSNYNKLCLEIPHAEMIIHTTHTNLSTLYAKAFYDWLSDGALKRIDKITHCAVTDPAKYRIGNLPPALRDTALEALSKIKVNEDSVIGMGAVGAKKLIESRLFENKFSPQLWNEFLSHSEGFHNFIKS